MWRIWAKALGEKHGRTDREADIIACIRTLIFISYNSSQLIRDRFKEWTAAEFAHTYTMRSVGCYNTDQASRKELVLFNYEA